MERFFSLFAALTVSGSLMALLLLLLRYVLFRNMPARVYYYLWLPVLLRFVLPVPGIGLTLPERDGAAAAINPMPSLEAAEQYHSPILPQTAAIIAAEPETADSKTAAAMYSGNERDTGETAPVPAAVQPVPWKAALCLVWAAGAVLSLARYIGGYLRFSRLVRKNSRRPTPDDMRCYQRMPGRRKPELIRSAFVRTPMLMGFAHPLLVLPEAQYSQKQLENIFLHELMHKSRRDILYKWLAVPVYSVQWFNPLVYLMRREINRACELSCDEMLILGMGREARQSYGDTLISLASAGRQPAGIAATSFSMEKQYLKERLVKIMKFKERKLSAAIALAVSVLLLAACAVVTGPQAEASTPEKLQPAADDGSITVSTVDELLAAIAPDTTVRLQPGVYDLTEATDYGTETQGYYSWEECYDGYELNIKGVDGLKIIGYGVNTTIATQPRYANVLKFVSCNELSLEGVVVGHTEKQGWCSGGVLWLGGCENVSIDSCKLFGCGTIGIYAENCTGVKAVNSSIYECSQNAVYTISSYSVILDGCEIHDCGEGMAQCLFSVNSSIGFAVVNSEIYANSACRLMDSNYSLQTSIQGCELSENMFSDALILSGGYSVTLEGCSFDSNYYSSLCGDGLPIVDAEGNELGEPEIFNMQRRELSYKGPVQAEKPALDETVGEDGLRRVTVSTVDEFLAAIGDDTVITLAADEFDLSTAADYGAYGNENYYWEDIYDGPGLVISGVKNLSIVGEGAVIAAIPRYANVLGFVHCENIRLEGFTAGHTEEPGTCAGGVLDFRNCSGIEIENCRLYGCGILGIAASGCEKLYVADTEIFDCSQGAIALYTVRNAVFENCDIHDCQTPEISLHDCSDIRFNGDKLDYGAFAVNNNRAERFEYPQF